MGRYVEDEGIQSNISLSAVWLKMSQLDRLGISEQGYEQLMHKQSKWEAENVGKPMELRIGGPSPLELKERENANLKRELKMDDNQFSDLMKRQCEWQTQVDTGQSHSREDPVAAAHNTAPKEVPEFTQRVQDAFKP